VVVHRFFDVLTLFYIVVICLAFAVKYDKKDIVLFLFGFLAMGVSEYFFIST